MHFFQLNVLHIFYNYTVNSIYHFSCDTDHFCFISVLQLFDNFLKIVIENFINYTLVKCCEFTATSNRNLVHTLVVSSVLNSVSYFRPHASRRSSEGFGSSRHSSERLVDERKDPEFLKMVAKKLRIKQWKNGKMTAV